MKTQKDIQIELHRLGKLIDLGVDSLPTLKGNQSQYIQQRIQILQAKIDVLLWVLGEPEIKDDTK